MSLRHSIPPFSSSHPPQSSCVHLSSHEQTCPPQPLSGSPTLVSSLSSPFITAAALPPPSSLFIKPVRSDVFSSQLLFSHRCSSTPFIPSGVVTFLTPPHLPFSVKSHSFRPFIINLFILLQVLTFAASSPLSPFVYCLFFFFFSSKDLSPSLANHTLTHIHTLNSL